MYQSKKIINTLTGSIINIISSSEFTKVNTNFVKDMSYKVVITQKIIYDFTGLTQDLSSDFTGKPVDLSPNFMMSYKYNSIITLKSDRLLEFIYYLRSLVKSKNLNIVIYYNGQKYHFSDFSTNKEKSGVCALFVAKINEELLFPEFNPNIVGCIVFLNMNLNSPLETSDSQNDICLYKYDDLYLSSPARTNSSRFIVFNIDLKPL